MYNLLCPTSIEQIMKWIKLIAIFTFIALFITISVEAAEPV